MNAHFSRVFRKGVGEHKISEFLYALFQEVILSSCFPFFYFFYIYVTLFTLKERIEIILINKGFPEIGR